MARQAKNAQASAAVIETKKGAPAAKGKKEDITNTQEASKPEPTEEIEDFGATDDEIDSVLTDEDAKIDFTRNQDCMRKIGSGLLVPSSIFSSKKTGIVIKTELKDKIIKASQIPVDKS